MISIVSIRVFYCRSTFQKILTDVFLESVLILVLSVILSFVPDSVSVYCIPAEDTAFTNTGAVKCQSINYCNCLDHTVILIVFLLQL